jgi:RNA recognition motif-containing protein
MAIMDDYTVQVCNLSPKATMKDVKQFFSYSGTGKNVKLQSAGQWAQLALVTFKEPYALETAVLLSGATIIDQKVCIVPWGGSEEAVNRWKKQMKEFQEEGNTKGLNIFIPSADQAVNVVTTMLSKGYTLGKDTVSKSKELDEKYQVMNTAVVKVADFGKFMGEKSKVALIAAGNAACSAGTSAVNSSYFAAGALKVVEFLTGQPELLLIWVIEIKCIKMH